MAKLVDLSGKWAAAIGRAFVAFGSIEHTTVVCLEQLPRDKTPRFTASLRLGQRIDLLVEILESRDGSEFSALSMLLSKAKELAKTRNLIAHNPLVLEFFEDDNGDYHFKEHIAAIHKIGHKISLSEVEEFAVRSEDLASNLISSSINAFKAAKR